MYENTVETFDFTDEKNASFVRLHEGNRFSNSYSCDHIDYELGDPKEFIDSVPVFLESLPDGVLLRFNSRSDSVFSLNSNYHQRAHAISQIGRIENRLTVSFEAQLKPALRQFIEIVKSRSDKKHYLEEARDFLSKIDPKSLLSLGLRYKNEDYDDTPFSQISSARCGLNVDDYFVAVIKLQKLAPHAVSTEDLINLRLGLPLSYEICFTAKKLEEKKAQFLMNMKSKQEEASSDLISQYKKDESDRARAELVLSGKKLFSFEFSIILKGHNEEELLSQAYKVKRDFRSLGDFEVETFGAYSAFKSTLIGSKPHVPQIEFIDKLQPYLPIFMRGCAEVKDSTPRSLCFHREDSSIDHLEPFNNNYSNYSGIVIGVSGRGKSVFTSQLLRSLNNDPKTRMILVDVRSSHTRTVEKLKGEIHQISAETPCGISPFELLKLDQSTDTLEIVLDFLEKILLEEGEPSLSKPEKAQLHSAFSEYLEIKPRNPSIDEFLKSGVAIPRKSSLEMWKKTGLYGKIFAPYPSDSQTRIHYFDFKEIHTAAKSSISSAVMSAVMAHFYFQLKTKHEDERIIFIADETPFFVKSCFETFKLLVKNLRKLGGSLILVAQNLSDLVPDSDSSLVNQTEFRIFFSRDRGSESFRAVSGLSDRSLELLDTLQTRKGKYSEFILKDSLGERKGKLSLSFEEYLTSTTFKDDLEKIERVQKEFGIKDKNRAIEFMALAKEELGVEV